MTTKVEQASSHTQTTISSPSTAAAATVSKISIFAKKSGFVIPKNKLSGSLVPILRGKKGSSNTASEGSIKQVQRKTKWGQDLTQDTAVKKGRAFAYQTRLDQITQQLGSRSSETRKNQDSTSGSFQIRDASSDHQLESEESEYLELERREVIGEILQLNPSYKAPAEYKPLLKEAKVPIHIKEYPGYNFIGLIFGPANDTQKRLEKETGAKIRVYGTKEATGEEVEVTSDGPKTNSSYEELHIHVSADTYEKVDAAVALIELLVRPVSENPASVSTIVSGDSVIVAPGQGTSAASISQGVVQPIIGSAQAAQSNNFQQYAGPWFQMVAPTPDPVSNLVQMSSSPLNPSNMSPLYGPIPGAGPAGLVPQNPSIFPSGPHPQLLSRPYIHQLPPGNPFMPVSRPTPSHPNFTTAPQLSSNQSTLIGPSQFLRPGMASLRQFASPANFSNQHMTYARGSAGWSQSFNASSSGPGNMLQSLPGHPLAHMQNLSPLAHQYPPQLSGVSTVTSNSRPPPLSGIPGSGGALGINPMKPSFSVPPQQPSSSNFTFQPHRPQNPTTQVQRPNSQPIHAQFNQSMQPPQGAQAPAFRPGMHNQPSSVMQGFPRPQVGNMMSQPRAQTPMNFASPTAHPGSLRHGTFQNPAIVSPDAISLIEPRNFSPVPPHIASTGFNAQVGGPTQVQQNYPLPGGRPQGFVAPPNHQFNNNISFRPAGVQVYDPFSPTAASQNPQLNSKRLKIDKQENDPEYEDLMASVGVK